MWSVSGSVLAGISGGTFQSWSCFVPTGNSLPSIITMIITYRYNTPHICSYGAKDTHRL